MQISSSKRIGFGCFVVLIAVAMTAVSFASTISVQAEDVMLESSVESYVRVGWLSDVYSWNPLTSTMVEDYVVSHLMFSTLFTYDQDWNGPVWDLATGYWQIVNSQTGKMTTYINITTTAYFRNLQSVYDVSHPLTAEDVAFTLNLIRDNPGGAYDWYLQDVSNITAVNTRTVSMDTPYAKATLIDDLAGIPIVPKYIWEDISRPLGAMSPGTLVGSGPFVFESYLKGAWCKFMTAPNYHGQSDYGAYRTVSIGGILYTVYTSTQGLTLDINSGVQDFVVLTGDMRSFLEALGAGASVNVYKAAVQEPGICDIAINAIPQSFQTSTYGTHHPALNDPNVRKALMMTLNKDYIVNVTLEGYATVGSSVIQPGYWQAQIENQLPYDPVAAKTWLMTHGWSADADSDGYLEATVGNAYGVPAGTELSGIRCQAPDTDPTYGTIAMAWQGWARSAGIGFVSTMESEITMINIAWYKADYDIWVWHWGWGPEPLGGALSCWLTSEIETGGDNCQMPMGPWWYDKTNYTLAPSEWGLTGPYSAYDQNYTLAMETLNIADRKVTVDKLQQWIYDSHTENPPYYDLGLYGYTDARFDNWGDVSGHSGLNVASDLLWIWFNVRPVINSAPLFAYGLEDGYLTQVSDSITISVNVSDADGDDLDVVFDFGDGSTAQYTLTGDTTMPTGVVTEHAYEMVGVYTLSVSLTDNFVDPVSGPRDPIVMTSVVEVVDELNMAPLIRTFGIDDPPPANVGYDTTWTIGASDAESDEYGLRITWDWDDGTYDVYDIAPFPANEIVLWDAIHAWDQPGTYLVEVSVWDNYGLESGMHNVSITTSYWIQINQPPEGPYIYDILATPGVPETCYAVAYDTGYELLKFTWEWDDGTYTIDEVYSIPDQPTYSSVVHTWWDEGAYPVTVCVDDGEFNVSVITTAFVSISMNPPNVWFDVYPGVGTTETYFTLDPSYTWDIEDPYSALVGRWDFEADGVWDTPYESLEVKYVQYDTIGFKDILLEVMDTSGLTSIANNTLVVDDQAPTADAGPDASIAVGDIYTFDGTGSSDDLGISYYRWTFVYNGYTQYMFGPTPSFMFDIEDVYAVTLTVWDRAGRTDTDTMVLTVSDAIVVTKNQGSSKDSVMSWAYTPDESGAWIAWIENHGLRSLTIEIYDTSGSQQTLVAEMKIRFSAYDAYPIGIVWTDAVPMDAGKTYQIVVSPQGSEGTYAILNQKFVGY
ncbi:MAG: hypothetical protein KKE24_04840 [Candidatus Thermoplasmatota archaeon]|nr:hypothetical protein [Candidatus Thermoplasmatota archaeon]